MKNEKLPMRMNNLKKNYIVKDATIKEELKEIKSPNWIDKNKFKEILTIIDSNKFGHENKIGEFKYIDIKDLVNNIKNNTISEIDAKKDLNKLNEIKNVEIIKYKKRTPGHKKLLNLFNDLLDIILTDKTLESESQEDENKNENEKLKEEKENENENKDENENENMLLEYIENVDDKLFKKYSQDKDFNSFINEFDRATNKEDKEKEFKNMIRLVNHYAQWEDNYSEYKYKLFEVTVDSAITL